MSRVWRQNSGRMGLDQKSTDEDKFSLSEGEKSALLQIAREAIVAEVRGERYNAAVPKDLKLLNHSGAFVTLREGGELRGCIGYIEARLPLYETVAQTGAKAATGDPRFDSVTKDEIENLNVEISVLSPLRKIKSVDEIVVGKHGILIEKGFYRGLLLPQVATENNWDREKFLEYTCMKAGMDTDSYKRHDVNIYVFTAEVFGEDKSKKKDGEDEVEGT